MMQQIANFIVDHDPMMVIQRTHDTVRYIRWAWNKDHADLIDEDGAKTLKFLEIAQAVANATPDADEPRPLTKVPPPLKRARADPPAAGDVFLAKVKCL